MPSEFLLGQVFFMIKIRDSIFCNQFILKIKVILPSLMQSFPLPITNFQTEESVEGAG
jgi:hypothetical protein